MCDQRETVGLGAWSGVTSDRRLEMASYRRDTIKTLADGWLRLLAPHSHIHIIMS